MLAFRRTIVLALCGAVALALRGSFVPAGQLTEQDRELGVGFIANRRWVEELGAARVEAMLEGRTDKLGAQQPEGGAERVTQFALGIPGGVLDELLLVLSNVGAKESRILPFPSHLPMTRHSGQRLQKEGEGIDAGLVDHEVSFSCDVRPDS